MKTHRNRVGIGVAKHAARPNNGTMGKLVQNMSWQHSSRALGLRGSLYFWCLCWTLDTYEVPLQDLESKSRPPRVADTGAGSESSADSMKDSNSSKSCHAGRFSQRLGGYTMLRTSSCVSSWVASGKMRCSRPQCPFRSRAPADAPSRLTTLASAKI